MDKIGFIGTGNMGSAIIRALAKSPDNKIFITDVKKEMAQMLADQTNTTFLEPEQLLESSDIIFLAVKPQILPSLYPTLAKYKNKKWISMAAGISLETLTKNLQSSDVIRIMPNIASSVEKSVTAVAPCKKATKSFVTTAMKLVNSFGLAIEVDESLISAFTAISGSAIATVFAFLNGIALGGVREGFGYEEALKIISLTTEGAVKLLQESKIHPEQLISQVCSPQGTTIEAIKVLESNNFKGTLMESVSATTLRANQLEADAKK